MCVTLCFGMHALNLRKEVLLALIVWRCIFSHANRHTDAHTHTTLHSPLVPALQPPIATILSHMLVMVHLPTQKMHIHTQNLKNIQHSPLVPALQLPTAAVLSHTHVMLHHSQTPASVTHSLLLGRVLDLRERESECMWLEIVSDRQAWVCDECTLDPCKTALR